MDRREFCKFVGVGVGGALFGGCGDGMIGGGRKVVKRPNIIYIYTDQQSAAMMSCAGNKWLKTPGMDYIAENGIRFTRAYSPNPVCSPARVSMITGRFPGYFNGKDGKEARSNNGSMSIRGISDEVMNTTISAYLKQCDYELVFGGKEHLPKELRPKALGFNDITDDERDILAEKAADYIKAPHEKPYFMVVSLINPHDICYYLAIKESASGKKIVDRYLNSGKVEVATLLEAMKLPEGVSEDEFYEKHCPPVPVNFEPLENEPEAINVFLGKTNRRNARDNFSDKDWRMHRWAYCRLTEFVDEKVQTILDAIKESGTEEDTLVIFSSDHGDMSASHRLEHKTVFFEESANVPFMAMWKGHIPAGQVDDEHLVSNGLDLLPTVCDYAGIKGVADDRGRSLRPLFEGDNVRWRDTLGVESKIGRMVVSKDGLKYMRYDAAGKEERLLDLSRDPHETTYFTDDPKYAARLDGMREIFESEWFEGH